MDQTVQIIDITETQAVESKALQLPDKARLIVVDSNDGMTMADNTVNDIDTMIKEIDGVFQPLANKAHQAHIAITGKWKEVKQPLVNAKDYLVVQVKKYKIKLREEAEAETRRLEAIARKVEEDRHILEAEQAEKDGNIEEAQAIIEEPIYIQAPVVKAEMPKVNNKKYQILPRARIVSKLDVIKTVANNPALQDLIDINQSVANQKAKTFGKALSATIKGLEYYEE